MRLKRYAAMLAAGIAVVSYQGKSWAQNEPALAGDNSDAPVQFERQGYFIRDPDSRPGRLVFNRTVGLRVSWV